jgi:NAD(P)-dependent dehydrogenase (short-subunit alcohol dehydrogenase family)
VCSKTPKKKKRVSMGEFNDKVAIITGAKRGIGRDTAIRFAKEGIHVVMAGRGEEEIFQAFEKVKTIYPENKGFGVSCDVTDPIQVKAMVLESVKKLDRIDILINNAAVFHEPYQVVEMPMEVLQKIYETNVFGIFHCAKYVGQEMIKEGRGNIIDITSWYGRVGQAMFSAYCSAKAAIINFCQCMALEMAPYGITVNGIAPGWVETEMHWGALQDRANRKGITFQEIEEQTRNLIPLRRRCVGDDIASACLYLSSQNGQVVTGQQIDINGGLYFN